MTRSFEDAQQLWAAQQFSYQTVNDWGDEIMSQEPDDTYQIENTVVYVGYCGTCSYEAAGFEITNVRTRQSIKVESSYSDMVNEISKFAEETE